MTYLSSTLGRGLAVATALMISTGVAAAATTVTSNAGLSPKHPVNAAAYPAFIKSVEEKTKGSLTFKHYTSGALLELKATMSGLRDGIADIGILVFTYHPAELPTSQIVGDLSNLGKDTAVMAGAATEFYLLSCPACVKEQANQGIVLLSGYAVPPYVLISKPKITTLADIKGKKLRAGGGSFSLWAEHIGATVVNIPVNEMYDAFSVGVIEAGVQTEGGLRSYSFWDVAKNVTTLPLGTFSGATLFSAGTTFWKDRTDAERAAMLASAPLGLVAQIEAYDEDIDSVIAPAKEKGVAFHEPAADLLKATTDFDKASIANVKKSIAEKRGVQNADALIDTYVGLIDKWTKLIAPIRKDYPAIQAALQKEIYDKIDAKTWGK